MTIPKNLAIPVKTSPGIIVRQHLTDGETSGIAERAVRRIKEGASAVLLQSKNGGRIPWNVTAIFQMFKTSWQMGQLEGTEMFQENWGPRNTGIIS